MIPKLFVHFTAFILALPIFCFSCELFRTFEIWLTHQRIIFLLPRNIWPPSYANTKWEEKLLHWELPSFEKHFMSWRSNVYASSILRIREGHLSIYLSIWLHPWPGGKSLTRRKTYKTSPVYLKHLQLGKKSLSLFTTPSSTRYWSKYFLGALKPQIASSSQAMPWILDTCFQEIHLCICICSISLGLTLFVLCTAKAL